MQIGLELLPTTPVQELTIDEVARRAGISRSLLFHYFATKREYYTAVTRAAADLLWEHLLPRPGHAAGRAGHRACSTGTSAGWRPTARRTWRSSAVPRAGTRGCRRSTRRPAAGWSTSALTALELPDDARRRQLVLAWFAFTEDLVGQWTREPDDVPRRAARPAARRPRPARAGAESPAQPARDVGARSADSSGGGCSFATTSGALAPVASIDFLTVAP